MTFQERLKAVLEKGNLRTADLARWFERRHSTVRGWLDGRVPSGPPRDIIDLFEALVRLEIEVSCRRTITPRMAVGRRIAYLEKLERTSRRKMRPHKERIQIAAEDELEKYGGGAHGVRRR